MASAAVRSLSSRLSQNLREIRVHLCQTSAASKGARDFVEQHYVTLKKSNPEFPILIRECSGVQARVWARYDFGKESSISVDNMSADQVASALHTLVQPKP
ncbi:NADH dehydrogenase [ubiquinone] 1 alpha subcomplex subunit 2 [Limanda limanda]|uniref:NADH dehydrogenase [ubiquinone] 1 alpha subcomplex subunit 2 n=1 Tax=Hippoglossus hippoglossus TaxID=8267 RepID=UPI00148BF59A|nr:NADH dehydrogenase [ubiquinone] 1 alpha subcomplex subunit 2 [Hippoglossus hippoglossus]XP_035034635.1 NADH dehydrogenase [ubiquinone] 1 alpha subcomplex subunit 2 [Hippoglossus stenolepis]XP_060942123.1 NADH dehydrogenase [ubiquinone] 1 alpha subcomplex subunit 2 [Limanda limanda]